MFRFLLRDPNRNSHFNTAVTVFRVAFVFAFISLLTVLWRFSYNPPQLKSAGIHTYTITDHHTSVTHRRRHTTTHYNVNCVDEDGNKHSQKVDRSNYEFLQIGKEYICPAFTSEGGAYYISWDLSFNADDATREYYKLNPDGEMTVRMIIMYVPIGLTVFFIILGISELGLEKKYDREISIMREAKEVPGSDIWDQ